MESWQRLRGRMLNPMLVILQGARVQADHLTLLSLAAGLAFAPLYYLGRPGWAVAMLGLHAALDALDGPLARHAGTDSRRGSFTDTIVDQVVVAASTLALMLTGTVGALPGGLYIFLYTVVIGFAMARNALAIPYSWLVRPRFIVYGWIAAETWLWPGTIDAVLWIFAGLLGLKMLTGYHKIRRRI